MTYKYEGNMMLDIREYINENYTKEEIKTHLEDKDDFFNILFDDLWVCDSVTGNASGSYTFNRYNAKWYVEDNMELLNQAIEHFCIDAKTVCEKFLEENWEYFDVTIRCYLLCPMLSNVIDKLEEDQE